MPAPLHILVLCTGNSARSIMAEALLQHFGQGRVQAYSAGSQATGQVHPLALAQIRAALPLQAKDWRSKSWDEFAQPDAPEMDWVITVCDKAAGELCPIWPGQPKRLHWGFEDPAAVQGSPEEQAAAFARVFAQISAQVQAGLAQVLA